MDKKSTPDHRYDDIIDLPHYVSTTRAHMSIADRAAQFAPFAALTGYGAAVEETTRLTIQPLELDESEKEALNTQLRLLAQRLDALPEITVTYFQPDERKDGGAYVTVTGNLRKIDQLTQLLILDNGLPIPMKAILHMDSPIFPDFMQE